MDPGRADRYLDLAAGLLDAGFSGDAVPVLKKGLEIDPDDEGLCLALGEAHARLGLFAEALESYERAGERWPVRMDRGIALVNLGRAREAISSLRKHLRISPWHEEAMYDLALAYLQAGDLEGARAQWRALTMMQDERADALLPMLAP